MDERDKATQLACHLQGTLERIEIGIDVGGVSVDKLRNDVQTELDKPLARVCEEVATSKKALCHSIAVLEDTIAALTRKVDTADQHSAADVLAEISSAQEQLLALSLGISTKRESYAAKEEIIKDQDIGLNQVLHGIATKRTMNRCTLLQSAERAVAAVGSETVSVNHARGQAEDLQQQENELANKMSQSQTGFEQAYAALKEQLREESICTDALSEEIEALVSDRKELVAREKDLKAQLAECRDACDANSSARQGSADTAKHAAVEAAFTLSQAHALTTQTTSSKSHSFAEKALALAVEVDQARTAVLEVQEEIRSVEEQV